MQNAMIPRAFKVRMCNTLISRERFWKHGADSLNDLIKDDPEMWDGLDSSREPLCSFFITVLASNEQTIMEHILKIVAEHASDLNENFYQCLEELLGDFYLRALFPAS